MANPFIYKPTDVGNNIGDIARAFFTRGQPIKDALTTFNEGFDSYRTNKKDRTAQELLASGAGYQEAADAGVLDRVLALTGEARGLDKTAAEIADRASQTRRRNVLLDPERRQAEADIVGTEADTAETGANTNWITSRDTGQQIDNMTEAQIAQRRQDAAQSGGYIEEQVRSGAFTPEQAYASVVTRYSPEEIEEFFPSLLPMQRREQMHEKVEEAGLKKRAETEAEYQGKMSGIQNAQDIIRNSRDPLEREAAAAELNNNATEISVPVDPYDTSKGYTPMYVPNEIVNQKNKPGDVVDTMRGLLGSAVGAKLGLNPQKASWKDWVPFVDAGDKAAAFTKKDVEALPEVAQEALLTFNNFAKQVGNTNTAAMAVERIVREHPKITLPELQRVMSNMAARDEPFRRGNIPR